MTIPNAVPPEVELIARVRAGDERAFEQLFRRYHRELCIYAARVDPTAGAAEEIVQEIFFRVWESRDRLQDVRSLGGYLYAAVRNLALTQRDRGRRADRWRYAKTLELQEVAAAAPAADEDARAAEVAAAIERAVAALPPRCREAFLLRRQREMSYAEIAALMRTTPKTVEVQIGKALRLLREALADWI